MHIRTNQSANMEGYEELSYHRTYNALDKNLESFFTHPSKFKKMLKENKAIVTGSFLLNCIVPFNVQNYMMQEPNDIDIIVDVYNFEALQNMLLCDDDIDDKGYVVSKFLVRQPENRQFMVKKLYNPSTGKKIDIIIMLKDTPLEFINNFDLSCVMNFYDGQKIYMKTPFKDLTFAKKSFYRYDEKGEYNEVTVAKRDPVWNECLKEFKRKHRVDKYLNRGYTIAYLDEVKTYSDILDVSQALHEFENSLPHWLVNKRGQVVQKNFSSEAPVVATTTTVEETDAMQIDVPTYETFKKDVGEKANDIVNSMLKAFATMIDKNEEKTQVLIQNWSNINQNLYNVICKRFFDKINWPEGSVSLERNCSTIYIKFNIDVCMQQMQIID